MYIYLIERMDCHRSTNVWISAVVRAHSIEEAQSIHPDGYHIANHGEWMAVGYVKYSQELEREWIPANTVSELYVELLGSTNVEVAGIVHVHYQ